MALSKELHTDMGMNELYIKDPEISSFPAYYEKMIKKNKIAGVLPFRTNIADGKLQYVYTAKGMKVFSALVTDKKPDLNMLRQVVEGVISTVEKSKEYLLMEEDFLVQPDCIFLDSEGNIGLCCLPGYSHSLKEQFTLLFEYLMNCLDYEDKNAVICLYELYRKSKEMVFSFEDIRKVLNAKYETKEEPKAPSWETVQPKKDTFVREEIIKSTSQEKKTENVKSRRSFFSSFKSREAENETPELKTTLLNRAPENADRILRAEDGKEIIYLSCFPFYIGKGAANINCNLNYPQISRMHAKITKVGDEIRLEDMKSTNGCSINGNRIESGIATKISVGDVISFANRKYVFEEQT